MMTLCRLHLTVKVRKAVQRDSDGERVREKLRICAGMQYLQTDHLLDTQILSSCDLYANFCVDAYMYIACRGKDKDRK